MSKLQVSEGRWVAGFGHQHGFRLYQGSLDGNIIAHFNCSGGVATGLEAQANLTLCAAAPDLYAALEYLVRDLEVRAGVDGLVNCGLGAYYLSKKALAKAEGKEDSE